LQQEKVEVDKDEKVIEQEKQDFVDVQAHWKYLLEANKEEMNQICSKADQCERNVPPSSQFKDF